MVLYNKNDHLFTYFETIFTFFNAGEMVTASRVDTVDMEPYDTAQDFVRAALEVVFVVMWVGFVFGAARDVSTIRRRQRGGPAAAGAHGGKASPSSDPGGISTLPSTVGEYCQRESVILFSLTLQAVEIVFFLVLAHGFQTPYSIPARVDVYDSLTDSVRPMELASGSDAGLMQVESLMSHLKTLSMLNALYDMMHGLSLIVIVVRLLACALPSSAHASVSLPIGQPPPCTHA